MTSYTPDLIAKAKAAKSSEELFELAKVNGMEITKEDARTYFDQLNATGVVSDDELDVVAGGFLGISCPTSSETALTANDLPEGTRVEVINGARCPKCGGTFGISKLLVPNHPDPKCPLVIYCEKCQEAFLHPVTWSAIRQA